MNAQETISSIRRTNKVMTAVTWALIGGVVFYSLMTTTPFVASKSQWSWSGFVLGLMADAAFVMALQADSLLARLRIEDLGPWPGRFRWFTGLATVFLNVWHSVQQHDPVGVAVHLIGPALLMLVAEVGPVYRRAFAEALAKAEAGVDTAPAPAEVDDPPGVYLDDPAGRPTEAPVSTMTPQVTDPTPIRPAAVPAAVSTPTDRLDAVAAKAAIEAAWQAGLTVREAATTATRAPSYVGTVYARLTRERGAQPIAGQLETSAA